MVKKYVGRENWGEFLRVVERATEEDGTLSPGGASRLVGVSRQRVCMIVDTHEEVRAWAFYESKLHRHAEVYEINVRDLLRWAVKVGRVQSEEDLGVPFPRIKELLAEVLAEPLLSATKADTLPNK
jgi:hypothetical protein